MKKIFGLLCLVLFCAGSLAQNRTLDSLAAALGKPSTDQQRVELLGKLTSAVWDYDFERGLNYALEGYALAKKINYELGEILSITNIGQYYYYTGNYPTAKKYYQEALSKAGKKNFGAYPSITYNRLGNLYRAQAQFDSAYHCYQQVLTQLGNSPKHKATLASGYDNLGALYVSQSLFGKGIKALRQSISIRETLGDSLLLAESWKEMGRAYAGLSQFDSAHYFYQLIERVAGSSQNLELRMINNIYQGELSCLKGEYVQALNYCVRALDHLKLHDFKKYHAINLAQIGVAYDGMGNSQQALKYFFAAVKINERLNARQELAKLKLAIGWAYINEGLDSLSLSFANQSLAGMQEINDLGGMATAHNLIGYILYIQKKYDASLVHFNEALQGREAIENQKGISATLYNTAKLFEAQGMLDKALSYHLKSNEINKQISDLPSMAIANNAIGFVLFKQKRIAEAKQYLMSGMRVSLQTLSPSELLENYRIQAEVYGAIGELALAVGYYKKFVQLNDSIRTIANMNNPARLSAIYQLEKMEEEIQNLHRDNEINRSQIMVQQSQLRWQKGILIVSVLGLVFLLSLAGILYKYYRAKSRANEKLNELNQSIHEQNEEIQTQSEELVEANAALTNLNQELKDKTEEIQVQAEELQSANEMITHINHGLEESINERTGQLKQAYKELDTFFYRASHDFRRPLTTFMGLAEVAKVTVKDSNALELFEKVNQTANTLDKMLFKLQSISDLGGQHLIIKEVCIKAIIHEVLDLFKFDIDRQRIAVSVDVTADLFISYPTLIRIFVENLIENAIHFACAHQPTITIRVSRENGAIILEIADNGLGIDEQYHDRIFEMYFRASERSKGNGLGLYITKKAVEKSGGSITFNSALGVGTSFRVSINDMAEVG